MGESGVVGFEGRTGSTEGANASLGSCARYILGFAIEEQAVSFEDTGACRCGMSSKIGLGEGH